MFNLLIVDDEVISRVGLSNLMQWEVLDFCLIASASNGEEALAIMAKQTIDLVITDVRMPTMDGISLIQQAKEKSPHTLFVIMSSYDDFRYVREGFVLGALDYVLKCDLNQEMMQKLLEKAKAYLVAQGMTLHTPSPTLDLNTRKALQRSVLKQIYFQRLACDTSIIKECKRVGIILEDTACCEISLRVEKEFVQEMPHIFSFIEGLLVEYENAYLTQTMLDEITVLYNPTAQNFEDRENAIEEISERLSFFSEKYMGFSSRIYVSEWVNDLQLLPNCYMHLHQLSSYLNQGTCLRYQSLLEWSATEDSANLSLLIKEAHTIASLQDVCILLERMLSELNVCKYLSCDLLRTFLMLIQTAVIKHQDMFLKDALPEELFCISLSSIDEIEKGVAKILRYIQEHTKVLDNNYIVRATKQYVHQNYAQGIKVKEISREIGVSNSYLSALFHRMTGQTLKEYCLSVQFSKAKELLATTLMPIGEISNAVGYLDEQQFSRLFKQKNGVTPSAYRNQIT